MKYKILELDPRLKPYENDINLRMDLYHNKKKQLVGENGKLIDFANGHHYFGFHRTEDGWVYREWAPGAEKMYLIGDMNGWNEESLPLTNIGNGNWEIYMHGYDYLYNGCKVKTIVYHDGNRLERIPLYINRVVQDPATVAWCGEIVDEGLYEWHDQNFVASEHPFIYECHIGMAQEEEKIGSYTEFADNILPRIQKLGYNTIQIMAVMEHPYYGSFGYQVSNFFAASSRFGEPHELKYLIDKAHSMGIAVLLDVIHSHAVKNTVEGINEFDGTSYQFFHDGAKGDHPTWGTKVFDYSKPGVIHFLLSNLKYWQEEYHFDGFRFDGVTSMLYQDHGLGVGFTDYDKYFSMNTDVDAVTYLQLANEVIHEMNPHAITIAEDMSGMPGMCLPISDGGIGFDYRLSMGVPDMWIKLFRSYTKDEDWNMGKIYYELSSRRPHEKVIGYAESHDQALVGDKTIMFWLCDKAMYTDMTKFVESAVVDRGIALHKMITLISMSLAGEGYLNFMGNEFGHPEWIDFPREGNGWSYFYCRRQWHLADDPDLKYKFLERFDEAMIKMAKKNDIYGADVVYRDQNEKKKIIIYERNGMLFVFNFHPENSYEDYPVISNNGIYQPVLSTDDEYFGGFDRISKSLTYRAQKQKDGKYGFKLYLPARTAIVLKKIG